MDAAVFLDRDNTLIANDGDLGAPEAVRLLKGVPGGLKTLRDAGYRLIVVTNQAGVARGRFTEDDVDAVHQRIATLVDDQARSRSLINRFYYCPYHPEAPLDEYRRDHPWRKPNPGMLLQAARDLNLDLSRCWMVGDQVRDVEAGRAAGCRTILLSSDESKAGAASPTAVANTFPDVVHTIIREDAPANGTAATPRAPARAEAPTKLPPPPPTASIGHADVESLRAAVTELTEQLRGDQMRRVEFTGFRLAGGMCQLLALTLALLGLLQLGTPDVFYRWMIGAVMAQLITIALLLMDSKG